MKPLDAFSARRITDRGRTSLALSMLAVLVLTILAGCSGGSGSDSPAPLNAGNMNLVFVVSPDIAYQGVGDVSPHTGNLTSRGLQRSLLMAGFLKQRVLGGNNVTGIYALAPMTHLQTAGNYPDMAALGYIQQFALLNQFTMGGATASSYPLNVSYASGSVPGGVATPNPFVTSAQGLDFNDAAGNNLALANRIINARTPGYYVFSAPWETIRALMASINGARGYGLSLPGSYMGPGSVYAIAIPLSGSASLTTYNMSLDPLSTYPVLPSPVASASCNTQQAPFSITRTGGVNGAVIPASINTNSTVYLVRHAEAHPTSGFEDGNYIGAGQWRALALPDFLRGKISPQEVYAIDPAQSFALSANFGVSYVRPSLTVLPYAIANNLPYRLVSSFYIGSATDQAVAVLTSNFLFTGGTFSNKTIMLAWEHEHFPPLIATLIQSYGGSDPAPSLFWPQTDYDTIWRVTLDGSGNVTVDNALCEGIDSASLPATAPQF
jgi:hypothetical protein